jgi:hypothetical protein
MAADEGVNLTRSRRQKELEERDLITTSQDDSERTENDAIFSHPREPESKLRKR